MSYQSRYNNNNSNSYNNNNNSHYNGGGNNHYMDHQDQSQQAQQARKLGHRRTIDIGSAMGKYILNRGIHSTRNKVPIGSLRPEASHLVDLLPPKAYTGDSIVNEHTKFVHLSANKAKHQIHAMKWTPYGRRLLVASHSGEFTLWNGTTFNFESIMQAHDTAIYALQYSHNDEWLISGDQDGTIKYWQPNFNNVNILDNSHTGNITELCFSPNDTKFVSSSDDHFLKIWNFNNGKQEQTLSGHHWDVKSCDWHPSIGLIISGSKDNMINLWDPRASGGASGKPIHTIRSFKHTVQCTKFQPIGTQRLFAATAKDKSAKIFDIRQMKDILVLRNDAFDFASLTWHPTNSQILSLSDFNGKIEHVILDKCDIPIVEQSKVPAHNNTSHDANGDVQMGNNSNTESSTSSSTSNAGDATEISYTGFKIPYAHEKAINQIEYNQTGNILCTASSDKTIRFWARSRPGDPQAFKDATYTNQKVGSWYYAASTSNTAGAGTGANNTALNTANPAAASVVNDVSDSLNGVLNKNLEQSNASPLPPPPPPPPQTAAAGSTNGNGGFSLPGF